MRSILVLLVAAATLSACASSGALYSESKKSFAPVPADKARVFMYREASMMGSGVQPSILLDGVKVRDSVPGSYTMQDVKPGKHVISNETETEKRYEFDAAAKQEIFVREAIGMGWLVGRIHLEPVDAATAEGEISSLHVQTFSPSKEK